MGLIAWFKHAFTPTTTTNTVIVKPDESQEEWKSKPLKEITVEVDSEEFKKIPNPLPSDVKIVFKQMPPVSDGHTINMVNEAPHTTNVVKPAEPAPGKPVAKPEPAGDLVALKQNRLLANAGIEEAKKYLGIKELTGHNDGKQVNVFQAFVGDPTGEPWCAAFRSYCDFMAATHLGIKPVLPKTDSSTYLYAWAKEHGYLLKAPIPGSIGLEKGDGGTPGKTHKHTCRVLRVSSDGTFASVDGNWNNSVCYPDPMHKSANFDFVVCC